MPAHSPVTNDQQGIVYPPASEASREVENFDWTKNPHAPVYGVKEFVCLSVCYKL